MSKPTVVTLVGMPGAGKTALTQAIVNKYPGKYAPGLLEDIARDGCGWFDEPLRQRYVFGGDLSPAEVLESVSDGHRWILNDNLLSVDDVAACGYEQVAVLLVAAPWLREARCKLRYDRHPDAHEQAIGCVFTAEQFVEHVYNCGLPTHYFDASDYPLEEVTSDAAWAISRGDAEAVVKVPAGPLLYQQSVIVNGEEIGAAHDEGREWEMLRQDRLLPEWYDLTDKTVLDIGAAEGNFCWEAVSRGAVYAMAVETALPRVSLMRDIRNAHRLPVSTCSLDIREVGIPLLSSHETALRYDYAFLFNVLHHFDDPGAALRQVLDASNHCIIETPFGIGDTPYRPNLPPINHSMALPPLWVEQQAQAAGFRVLAIENSPLYYGQRLIFRLERN